MSNYVHGEYLAGHSQPIREVLIGNDKDIADDHRNTFVGMTTGPVSVDTLLEAHACPPVCLVGSG